jgi:pimeloyl-ACP methyl ester carboxylesterase
MGEGYEAWDRGLPPGWFEQAVADQAWIRQQGPVVPPITTWGPEVARRITQPAFLVLGEKAFPWWHQRHEHLLRSLPQAEPFVLPGATHAMQMMNPAGLADAMASFFVRQPMRVSI